MFQVFLFLTEPVRIYIPNSEQWLHARHGDHPGQHGRKPPEDYGAPPSRSLQGVPSVGGFLPPAARGQKKTPPPRPPTGISPAAPSAGPLILVLTPLLCSQNRTMDKPTSSFAEIHFPCHLARGDHCALLSEQTMRIAWGVHLPLSNKDRTRGGVFSSPTGQPCVRSGAGTTKEVESSSVPKSTNIPASSLPRLSVSLPFFHFHPNGA